MRRGELSGRVGEPGLRGLHRDLGAGQLLAQIAAVLRVFEHGRDAAAVLALEPRDRGEPLLDSLEATRLRVQSIAVAADLAEQVLGLDRERACPDRQLLELPIE